MLISKFITYNFDEENKLTERSPKFMGSIYVVLQLKKHFLQI